MRIERAFAEARLIFFREFLHDLRVRMIDPFLQEFSADRSVGCNRIPQALIHVESGSHARVFFPQLDRQLRIAFDVEAQRRFIKGYEQEHLTGNLEY